MHTRHPVHATRGQGLQSLQARWTWFRSVLVAHYPNAADLPATLEPTSAAVAGSLARAYDPDVDDVMGAPFESKTFTFAFGEGKIEVQDWQDSVFSSRQSVRLRTPDIAHHVSLQLGSLDYLELHDDHPLHAEWMAALDDFEGGRAPNFKSIQLQGDGGPCDDEALARRWTWFRALLVEHYDAARALPAQLKDAPSVPIERSSLPVGDDFCDDDDDDDDTRREEPVVAGAVYTLNFGACRVVVEHHFPPDWGERHDFSLRTSEPVGAVHLRLSARHSFLRVAIENPLHGAWIGAVTTLEGGLAT